MEPGEITKEDLAKFLEPSEDSENDLEKRSKSSEGAQNGMRKAMETSEAHGNGLPEVREASEKHEKKEQQRGKRKRSDSQTDSVSEASSVSNEKPAYPKHCKPDYVPGDLLWVKIGSFPFWPSMVIESPVEKIFYRWKKTYFVYYVQYFGIEVKHGWTPGPGYVLPYEGEETYQTLVKQRSSKSKTARKLYARKFYKKTIKSDFEKALEEIEEARLTRPVWKRHRTFRFLFPQEGNPDSDESSDSEHNLPKTAFDLVAPESPHPQHVQNKTSSNERKFDQLSFYDQPITDITNAASRMESPQRPPAFKYITLNKIMSKRSLEVCEDLPETCTCNVDFPCIDMRCSNRSTYTECDSTCRLGNNCENKRLQQRRNKKTEPFLTSDGRGWGLKLAEFCARGEFVIEYVGEVIDKAEYETRLRAVQENGIRDIYFLQVAKNYIIDAGPAGNESRFINHSCAPNLRAEKWAVKGRPCVGLFAERNMNPGEELTFKYNMQSEHDEANTCLCGTELCAGSFGHHRSPLRG